MKFFVGICVGIPINRIDIISLISTSYSFSVTPTLHHLKKVISYKEFHKNNKNKSMCMNTYIKRVLILLKFAFVMSITSLSYSRKHIIILNF